MKKTVFVTVMLFLAGAAAFAQEVDTLDKAIKDSMDYFIGRLEPGTKVAVLNFSASPAVSEYVIDKMDDFLVNKSALQPIARSELELKLLQAEKKLQLSGEVSDESAVGIGKMLGVQTIISGSLRPLGKMWLMSIRALEVETARIQGIKTYTIKKIPSHFTPKTIAEKVGTGALNIIFGLGSYLDGDISGGLTLTAGYAGATALFVIEAVALDWDSPAVGVPATIGITAAGLTIVYGFVRPFISNRDRRVTAFLDTMRIDVAPTSGNGFNAQNGLGLRLTYTKKF